MSKTVSSSSFVFKSNTTVSSDAPANVRITRLETRATFIAGAGQPIPGLTELLWNSSSDDLAGLVQHDLELMESIDGHCHACLNELSLDQFTRTCLTLLAAPILCAIDRFAEVQHWTMTEAAVEGIAVDRIVSDVLAYLELPATRTLACTALVILLMRGLQAERSIVPATTPRLHIRFSSRWPYLRISVPRH